MKDAFGPEYVVHVYDPKINMEGFLVIHNTALGLGKGGLRMTPTVTAEEVYRLAYTMTWKNAIAGIPLVGQSRASSGRVGATKKKKPPSVALHVVSSHLCPSTILLAPM